MSEPRTPEDVKLVSSLFSPERALVEQALEALADRFGPMDEASGELLFDRTRYYAREMGWPLYRRFVSFERLVPPDRLPDIKHRTNALEKRYLQGDGRRVNIDPGVISAERLVLATGKNYIHRVYLTRGIYADLTLLFKRGGFQSLDWTYPDYAEPGVIAFFNRVRARYMEQLRERRRLDAGAG